MIHYKILMYPELINFASYKEANWRDRFGLVEILVY